MNRGTIWGIGATGIAVICLCGLLLTVTLLRVPAGSGRAQVIVSVYLVVFCLLQAAWAWVRG